MILSDEGRAFIVQTECPRSATLYETRNFLPRGKRIGADLAARFGGTWVYVRGFGCRGAWAVNADSVEQLAQILTTAGIPVNVYRYPGTEVPGPIDAIAVAVFVHSAQGNYDQRER